MINARTLRKDWVRGGGSTRRENVELRYANLSD